MNVNDKGKAVSYPLMPGMSVVYHEDETIGRQDFSLNDPAAIVIEHCPKNNFCFLYCSTKQVPAEFSRYTSGISILLIPSELDDRTTRCLPEISAAAQELTPKFQLADSICIIKSKGSIEHIFQEMYQVPLPSHLFKVMELLLQLRIINTYSTDVHFYKAADKSSTINHNLPE